MELLLEFITLVVSAVLLVPALVFSIECFTAVFARHDFKKASNERRPTICVLIPAHNEDPIIQRTIECLRLQLEENDRLIVVADMCDDGTAEIARSLGAIVIERPKSNRRGKGYALEFGLRFLARTAPQVVVVMDADCVASPGTIEKIAVQAIESGRPIQARYWMELPSKADYLSIVSAFAFMVKNTVRPLGLNRLGLPCSLMGTGMAFPWSLIEKVDLAGSNLVEDLQLGVDLALIGYPPLYLPDTEVISYLPGHRQAAIGQRRRWEHGHLSTLFAQVPRLVAAGIRQRRIDLLALALDISVPPLSLLVIILVAATGGALLVGGLGGSWLPACLLGLLILLVIMAVSVSWIKFGRPQFPLRALLLAPLYVVYKLPLYFEFLVRRQSSWVRTERDSER